MYSLKIVNFFFVKFIWCVKKSWETCKWTSQWITDAYTWSHCFIHIHILFSLTEIDWALICIELYLNVIYWENFHHALIISLVKQNTHQFFLCMISDELKWSLFVCKSLKFLLKFRVCYCRLQLLWFIMQFAKIVYWFDLFQIVFVALNTIISTIIFLKCWCRHIYDVCRSYFLLHFGIIVRFGCLKTCQKILEHTQYLEVC